MRSPPPMLSPSPSLGVSLAKRGVQRQGKMPPNPSVQKAKLLTATYLKLLNPFVVSKLTGSNPFNPLQWPFILGGMGVSLAGGHLAEHLLQAIQKEGLPQGKSSELLYRITDADLSGLLLDETPYPQLGKDPEGQYYTKYGYFLKQWNQLGGHALGLFNARDTHPKAHAQRLLSRYIQQIAQGRITRQAPALLSIHLHNPEHLPFPARLVNAFVNWKGIRLFTTTPFFKLIPDVHSQFDFMDSWISNIPIFGAVLDSKAKALSNAKRLYFQTDPEGHLTPLRLRHWKTFQKTIRDANRLIEAENNKSSQSLPLLQENDATFKQYLHLRSRYEKQLAVRFALYKTFFNLFPNQEVGLLLKMWHDVDGAVPRSMFDLAQSRSLKEGGMSLALSTVNQGYATLMNGGFATLVQFGTSFVKTPFEGIARFLGDAFMFSFDIRLTPIIKPPFTYKGEPPLDQHKTFTPPVFRNSRFF